MESSGTRTTLWCGRWAALLCWAVCAVAVGDFRLQPEAGVTDVYRVRMSTYSGQNQMPMLIIAVEYRDTALDDGRRQIDVLRAERYQPFGSLWLPSIIDSVDPSQDNLPEDVQLRILVDRETPVRDLMPDDIPDIAFGMLTELILVVRAHMDDQGVGALERVGDSAPISPVRLKWHRQRTNTHYGRSNDGGTAVFEALEGNQATVRWIPDTIRWITLQIGSPNQVVTSEQSHETVLTIDSTTGKLLRSMTERDAIQTTIVGAVDFAELPAWDAIDVPEDAQVHVTHRFIEVQRLEDYEAEQRLRKEGDDAPAGPPAPGSDG